MLDDDDVLLQWQGNVTTTVIESGVRWMNVKSDTTVVPTTFYLLALVQAVVDGGRLPSFAMTTAEKYFFKMCNVTTAFAPVFLDETGGYNSGNTLLCMML